MVSQLLLVCALCGAPGDPGAGLRLAASFPAVTPPRAERPSTGGSLWGAALLQLGLASAESAGSVVAGLPAHRLVIDIPAALGALAVTTGAVLGVAWLLRDGSVEGAPWGWGKVGGALAIGAILVAPAGGVLAAEALAGNRVSAGGLLAGTAISLVAWLIAWVALTPHPEAWLASEGGSTLQTVTFAGISLLAVGAGATLGHALVNAP